jgi:hypothetical protein
LTFVIVLAALGLPLALVLAWAFDIGPVASSARGRSRRNLGRPAISRRR